MESTAVSVQGGTFALPAFHAGLQAEAEELAGRFADRHREVRRHALEHGELHPELWQEICGRGWPGLLVPAADGGRGDGLLAFVVVMEALAAANLILWMPVLTASIGHAIAEAGPEPARRDWLPRIAAGEALFAFAVTEAQAGHNVFQSQTTIARDGGRFVINGAKSVTSGVDLADRIVVFGQSADAGARGFTAVLVDPAAPGIERTEVPMRYREGARQYQLAFSNVEAPLDGLIGAEGQALRVLWPFTHVERLVSAALCMGSARYCISRARDHAASRTVFGQQPIGADQAIQHPLAALHARTEATRLLVYRGAARFDAQAASRDVVSDANMAKLLAADVLFGAADHAMQTFGARAWDEREGLIDIFLDARAARSAPVSQELALSYLAEHVLGLPSHR